MWKRFKSADILVLNRNARIMDIMNRYGTQFDAKLTVYKSFHHSQFVFYKFAKIFLKCR